MAADTSSKFWLTMAALGCGLAAVFWPEITDSWSNPVSGIYKDGLTTIALPLSETDQIAGFRLGTGATPPLSLRTDNLKTTRISNNTVALVFTLASSRASAVYPSIRISLVDENDKVVRTVVLSNTQYTHGSLLTSEPVAIDLRLQAGEAGCKVWPFFPQGAP